MTTPALRFPVATIRAAIRELLEGQIGVYRVPAQGLFKYGTFDGQPLPAEQAHALQADVGRHWFNVRAGRIGSNRSTPIATNANYRHANVFLTIELSTHLASTVEEDERDEVLGMVGSDMEAARAALSYPGNLDADSQGDSTLIVGGMLLGPDEGELDYESVPDWGAQLIRSRINALAIVQIAQEV